MTWDHTRDLPWAKVYDAWFSSPSHIDLDIVTLGIGIRCMQLANRRGRQPDGSGALVNGAGAAMSLVGLAREAHATPEQVAAALDQLVAVGTMQKRGDVYVFPHLQRWQEDPSAERQRRHRGKGETASVTVTPNVTAPVTPPSRTDDRSKKEEERSSERDPDPERARTDRPQGQPGAFGAKVASETPTLRVVEPELVPEERLAPWDPRAPEPAPRGDGRQVLSDDAFGADEVIGVYNAHRPPGLPACEPDEEDRAQLVRDIVGVIREARKADKSARAAGRPPSLGLHTVEGWIAFCERMHQAPPLLNFSPLPTLAKWVAGQGGARMRAALKRGDYDGERATSAPRETVMERNVREAFERARGADDRADNEPAWAAMLTAGSGAAAVKRR